MSDRLIKCLIWDLDGTLWRGEEDGAGSPVLYPGAREVLSWLDKRGVLLSIASINDREEALAHLTRLGVADYFLAPEIHFGPKHESVVRIAQHLGIRLQEVAFIDDDPLQRGLLSEALPDVLVLDAEEYQRLPENPHFAQTTQTTESRQRRKMLQTEAIRRQESACFDNLEGFLNSCALSFRGRAARAGDGDRIEELARRSNRMNATGWHASAAEIRERLANQRLPILLASLSDRFGDYGTVAAAFLALDGEVASVEGLWISCRVSQRGVPTTFFSFLARFARRHGSSSLRVDYYPTGWNRMAAFHLGTYGFQLRAEQGRQVFHLDLPGGVRPYPSWMAVDDH